MQDLWASIIGGFIGALLTAIVAFIIARKTNLANKKMHEDNMRATLCADIAKMIGEYSAAISIYHANKVKRYMLEKKVNDVTFNSPYDKRSVQIYQGQRDAIILNRDEPDSLVSIIKIRLHGIESAKLVLDRLISIHENSSEDVLLENNKFQELISDLTKKTTEFIDTYKTL